MAKVLVVRYEGTPFAIRMSKVIRTILGVGWHCDILIPKEGMGEINVSREMGWDLERKTNLFEFPTPSTTAERLEAKLLGPRPLRDRLFQVYLTQMLRSREYDVVLVKDTLCLAQVFEAVRAADQREPVVVCDMYENATEQWYDHLIRFGTWRSRAATAIRASISRLRRVERACLPKCDHIFVVVEEARDYLVQRYRIQPSKISVVHNVEILSEFDRIPAPSQSLATNGEILISYVGGLGAHRGIEILIDSLPTVAARTHLPFRVAIVGARDKEKDDLMKLRMCRGLEEYVTIVGYVPHVAAMQWIKASQIGVIPHRDTGFVRTTIPNKLFQYMAARAMCVVADVGALGRIVRETGCGLTFRPGSAASLASQLEKALENPEQTRTMALKGRMKVESDYRWETEGELYAEYFSSLAAK